MTIWYICSFFFNLDLFPKIQMRADVCFTPNRPVSMTPVIIPYSITHLLYLNAHPYAIERNS
jgi:hypothetical protein